MNEAVLLAGSVILICILISRFLEKIPVPSMLIFIVLGMFFGRMVCFASPSTTMSLPTIFVWSV